MATSSLNPGVGPTNADIAAAVAAPSAATIAAAVAAPSAATIAAAVAAPSAATIASTVAASVPTLAQINTAVNTQTNNSAIATAVAGAVPTLSQINTAVANNAPSPNAWTVISTISPNNTVGSYSFTGLSGYKTYKLLVTTQAIGAVVPFNAQINSDTNTNYAYGLVYSQSSLTGESNPNTNRIFLGNGPNGGWFNAELTIRNANIAAYKSAEYFSISTPNVATYIYGNGMYRSTSNISSIQISNNGSATFNGGTITLLGAN